VKVFFTSDTHFGDHRVLNIRSRPFSCVSEMNDVMIARWNARVSTDDEIWHLGDFASGLKIAHGRVQQAQRTQAPRHGK